MPSVLSQVAKDISSTKLWRRITITNGRRAGAETDMVNIKLRKVGIRVAVGLRGSAAPRAERRAG